MSATPLPYSKPSLCVAVKGSESHCSIGPVGTTSVWPNKTSILFPSPIVAQRLETSPKFIFSTSKPRVFSLCEIKSWHPISWGVTEGLDISSFVKSKVLDI